MKKGLMIFFEGLDGVGKIIVLEVVVFLFREKLL